LLLSCFCKLQLARRLFLVNLFVNITLGLTVSQDDQPALLNVRHRGRSICTCQLLEREAMSLSVCKNSGWLGWGRSGGLVRGGLALAGSSGSSVWAFSPALVVAWLVLAAWNSLLR
jgi:hypothetical protein